MYLEHDREMKRMIMLRVRTIYLARQIIKPLILETLLMILSAGVLLSLVDEISIVKNSIYVLDVSRIFNYISYAFFHTQTSVQVLSVTSLVCGIAVAGSIAWKLKESLPKFSLKLQ